VESWQADPDGRFAHPDDPRGTGVEFRGFGRCPTDAVGDWAILTVRPGPVPDPAGRPQAPHINLSIFARGLLDRVVTRVYLPEEPANAEDPVLSGIDEARRGTLIAVPADDGLRFDVRLRGPGEAVFFSV
jgi:protocatechuate 3,4-dioxygenase alpha subunit